MLLIPSSNVTKDEYANYFEPLGIDRRALREVPLHQRGLVRRHGLRHLDLRLRHGHTSSTSDVWTAAGVTDAAAPRRRSTSPTSRRSRRPASLPITRTTRTAGRSRPSRATSARCRATDVRTEMIADDAPWTEGNDQYNIDGLLLRHGRGRPQRGRPDHHELGGVEGPPRPGRDRLDGPRLLGRHADAGRRRDGRRARATTSASGRCPGHSDGAFTSVTASDKFLGDQQELRQQGDRRAWIDWFTERLRLRRQPGRDQPGHRATRRPTPSPTSTRSA